MIAVHKAAKLLKTEFGASEIILFGSLVWRRSCSLYSYIDMAVRGIAPEKFFTASAAIELVDVNLQIALADLETCLPAVLNNIEKDRKPL